MNASTAVAGVLVDELIRNGVREAVLSPGSRSAPLAFALHAADAAGHLRLHVRIDERSAAFLALGLAKASGLPVPMVTTSGTAAANLHPAVLEASESGLPLVVLTADRPPELRGTGANQSVDQLKLYGSAVRFFHELGTPELDGAAAPALNGYVRGLLCRALVAARGTLTHDPGPVHVNIPFRAPLTPDLGAGSSEPALPVTLQGRPGGAAWTAATAEPAGATTTDGWPARTLVVVGDAPPDWGRQTVRLAEARGWPVVSEPSGNARTGPNALALGHLLLDFERAPDRRPDRVLVVGRPTLDRRVLAVLADPGVDVVVATPTARWPDAARTAGTIVLAVPEAADHQPVDSTWVESWRSADAAEVARAAEADPWSGPGVAAALHAALPPGSLLVAGSSMPARDLRYATPREGVTVLANRGAAGIDGTVSTAIGAALAWQAAGGGPAAALVGDLTFLHDSNGLLLGQDEARPQLAIVVVNNEGGGIFGLLEQGGPEHAAAFERIFATPTGADLAAVCGSSQTPYTRVSTLEELAAAVTDPREDLQVVEARVPRPKR